MVARGPINLITTGLWCCCCFLLSDRNERPTPTSPPKRFLLLLFIKLFRMRLQQFTLVVLVLIVLGGFVERGEAQNGIKHLKVHVTDLRRREFVFFFFFFFFSSLLSNLSLIHNTTKTFFFFLSFL